MKNFALVGTEENTSGLLHKGGIADLPLLRKLTNLPKVARAKFLGSDTLLFYQHMQVWQIQEPF